jgi:hypothetical protein
MSLATSVIKRTTTRRWPVLVVFRDGGTQFRVTVSALHGTGHARLVPRRGDEDRLVAEFRCQSIPPLASVQVRASGSRPEPHPHRRRAERKQWCHKRTSFNLRQPAPQFPPWRRDPSTTLRRTTAASVRWADSQRQGFYFASAEFDRRSDAMASPSIPTVPRFQSRSHADSLSRFSSLCPQRPWLAGGLPADRITTFGHAGTHRLGCRASRTHDARRLPAHRSERHTRLSGVAIPSVAGTRSSDGGGLMTSLTSSPGAFINEFGSTPGR